MMLVEEQQRGTTILREHATAQKNCLAIQNTKYERIRHVTLLS